MKPKPTISQDILETTTRRVFIYGIQDDNGTDIQNFSLDLTPPPDVVFRTLPGTSEGMNVLGIVIFSATMGKLEHQCLHFHSAFDKCPYKVYVLLRYHAWKNGTKWQCSGQLLPKSK